MYSEKELEEREFQLELVDRQITANNMIAVTLTMLAAAASFALAGFTLGATGAELTIWGLNFMWYCFVGSVVLSCMSYYNAKKYINNKNDKPDEILNKYVNKYRTEEKKDNT